MVIEAENWQQVVFMCYQTIETYLTSIGYVLLEIGSHTFWKITWDSIRKCQFVHQVIYWSKYFIGSKSTSIHCTCKISTLCKIWLSLDFNWGRFNVVHRLTVVRSTITVKYAYSTTTVKTMKFQKYRTVFKQWYKMFIIEIADGIGNLFVFLS